MSAFAFDDVSLRYGRHLALDAVGMDVPAHSFLALLGPSGCGKTSLLRLLAGLERPSRGRICIGGADVAGPGRFVEPQDRGLGMVFQSYALWPHMSVAGNVRFGLGPLRLGRSDREARVAEALCMTGLAALADRRPHELSGGQRQRVALARSLAARPGLLLLDEPLANLDAHLRKAMLAEFRRIHAETGTTMVLVTHDQDEAMAVADLVAVMDRGRLEQVAPPRTLFDRPATPMVARFVGEGRTVPVTVERRTADGSCEIRVGTQRLTRPGTAPPGPGWLCLHARDLAATPAGLAATVIGSRFADGDHLVTATLDEVPDAPELELRVRDRPATGTRLAVRVTGGWVLPREGHDAVALERRVLA